MRRVISSVLIVLLTSACLKTRAQLREDGEDAPRPVAAQPVQDVKPGGYAIDEVKDEITRLTGRIEDLERSQKEQKGGADHDTVKKLEDRIAQLEQAQLALSESVKKIEESPAVMDPNEVFKKAKDQFDKGEFQSAADSFGNYLKLPKIKKAEDATFYKAESYFKLKEYKKAIVEYSKFPEKFSKSTRMADVLFKIGTSFESLGMKDDAKGFFQELIEKYPKSPEAKKARKKAK